MGKTQRMVLNIMPCIAEIIFLLLSAFGLYASDKRMDIFPFNIVTYSAPFFLVLCIILSPVYLALLNQKFFRKGMYLKTYFNMLGVLIFKLVILNVIFMLFLNSPINIPSFIEMIIHIAIYDIVVLTVTLAFIFLVHEKIFHKIIKKLKSVLR